MDAEGWDRLFAQREWLFPLEPMPVVVDLVSTLTPRRVLELGVAEGRQGIWLAAQGWHVTAVDHSRVALDRARRRAQERDLEIECVLADAADPRATPASSTWS